MHPSWPRFAWPDHLDVDGWEIEAHDYRGRLGPLINNGLPQPREHSEGILGQVGGTAAMGLHSVPAYAAGSVGTRRHRDVLHAVSASSDRILQDQYESPQSSSSYKIGVTC